MVGAVVTGMLPAVCDRGLVMADCIDAGKELTEDVDIFLGLPYMLIINDLRLCLNRPALLASSGMAISTMKYVTLLLKTCICNTQTYWFDKIFRCFTFDNIFSPNIVKNIPYSNDCRVC